CVRLGDVLRILLPVERWYFDVW
nr:immunoglobulin heavy chain junction region [Macaca mulatta]MOY21662.1 immunoglobulin heavy chain junction region [Macaca mulatta]MOY21838.1 immunoglobulin heavy chain junction region [Macaca mulatta]MOY21870.1 immunoglobulin heavy chain junction region [Macaca mulatta]MOY21920.1 immunoglobulin heavy chain junction region [Macaca mulatta]